MVQRQSACHILHDLAPPSSSSNGIHDQCMIVTDISGVGNSCLRRKKSALVAQLQLENLQPRRTSDKVCMIHVQNNERSCTKTKKNRCRSARAQNPRLHGHKLQVPYSRTDEYTVCIRTSRQLSDSGTLSPQVLNQP